ncbi:DUF1351 domain-containing protein [Lactococcus allomyrinae]|nr:DUF1351 domain-containing protein [Lactococcus allomyrinae]
MPNFLETINFPEQAKMLQTAKDKKQAFETLILENEDDKKKAKSDRAEINKTLKEFKTQAKTVRDKVIGEFDTKVKEVVKVLDETQNLLKEKVEDYDLTWKHERENWVFEAIKLRITDDIDDFIDFYVLDDPRYENVSLTEKKIAEELDVKVAKIKSDLLVAQAISPQVAAIYKECLDIPTAIARDKQQQEEQARREAIAKAEAERQERERQEILARQKELERQAMVEAEITEAKENGEVINADKIREINQRADDYAEKEALKMASFTVRFEYKESDYPLSWQNPLADLEKRLQDLENVEVIKND